MIGAERVLAERTLAILTELRSEEPPKIDYLEAVARAIALQPGIRFPNEVAAEKRASAYRDITLLIQSLRNNESSAILWEQVIVATQAWLALIKTPT